jgi:DNA-binding response OmpR family regulator
MPCRSRGQSRSFLFVSFIMMNKPDSTEKRRVLVVEDDGSIAYILHFILKREGFEVVIAKDGNEAMEYIESGEIFALALIDILLPFYDGFQLIEKIRSLDHWANIPILVLSAVSQEKGIVRALKLGANDYVVKPFQPAELVARIKRFL